MLTLHSMSNDEEGASERSPLIAPSATTAGNDQQAASFAEQKRTGITTRRGIGICLSVWVLIFILTCNVSLIATIQSSIATELQTYDSGTITWLTAAYLIAVTSLTPVAGRLSLIFTSRIYLFASIVVQSCGLLITSQAPTFAGFLFGRAITGVGSAAITPVAFILVTELTSKKRRGLFFGCINTAYTTGVACGAIIAGALEPVVGWRAVFWLQIPVTMSAASLALISIPRPDNLNDGTSRHEASLTKKLASIDYLGVVSLVSAVVLLLYGLSASKISLIPIALAAADLVLFVLIEAKWAKDPIVPVHILSSRANICTGLATVGIMTARWSILFYTPVYAIAVRGWSKALAGVMLVPTNAGFAFGGLIVGWLHIRRSGSFYIPSLISIVLFASTTLIVSQISTPNSNVYGYVCSLFVNGMVTGALLNYTLAHVLHLTIPATHVIVIPLNAAFRGLSGSFGSSISGSIFLRTLQQSLEQGFSNEKIPHKADLIRKLVGTPTLVQQLDGMEYEVALQSYITAFRTLFIAGAVLALLMLVFQAGTGWKAPKSIDEDDLGPEQDRQDHLSPVVSRELMAT